MKTSTLRPHDVAVALQLVLEPDLTFPALAERVGLSLGESHNAVKRLEKARLVSSSGRRAVVPALDEFLVAGVRYAFPPDLGPETMGVPTSHSAPPLSERFRTEDVLVWPSARGMHRGQSLVPLYPGAPALAEKNPRLYRLLALVDALRTGRARERNEAKAILKHALHTGEI